MRVCARALLVAICAAAPEPAHAEDQHYLVLAQAETPSQKREQKPENPSQKPGASPQKPETSPQKPEAPSSAGESTVAPPPGVEILTIRGRGIGAIQTEVPKSVTQFDAATIQALGAQNVSDLARVTPNLEIVTGEATQANFFVRGVGLSDFQSNAVSAVAIMQDGVSLNAAALQLGKLFDVENVEVLRGPQSTGPDRNASAGAIHITSRRPTGQTSATMRASLGRYDATSEGTYDALIQDYEGALEFPLGESASTRLAFRLRDADPFKTNGCGGARPFSLRVQDALNGDQSFGQGAGRTLQDASICGEMSINSIARLQRRPSRFASLIPAGLPTRVGDEHNWAARGQLRFQPPGSEMDWLFNVHGSRLDQQSTLGQAIGTGFLQGYIPPSGGTGRSFGGPDNLGYQEPDQAEEWDRLCPNRASQPCKVASKLFADTLAYKRPLDIRPYRGDYNLVGQTTHDTWGGFLRGDIGVGDIGLGDMTLNTVSAYDAYTRSIVQDTDFTPDTLFERNDADQAYQLWQQLSLKGELDATPLKWDVGGYFLQENLQVDALTHLNFDQQDLRRQYIQDTWSWGLWGHFSWDFMDDFTLAGGVRYNYERQRFDYAISYPARPDPGRKRAVTSATWEVPTGEITLTYHFSEDVSAYGKYSRGFKAGHFNAASVFPSDNDPAKPEYLDSFEFGAGGSWLDGRLSASGALFYYLYEDHQLFLFTDSPESTGPVLQIRNARHADNYGADADLRLEPLSGWAPPSIEGLVLTAHFGWLESRFLDFQDTVVRTTGTSPQPLPVTVDYTNNRLPNSPRFAFSGSAEWTFDLGRWGALIPHYDFAWKDDVSFDATNGRGSPNVNGDLLLPKLAIGQPAFWLHNLRLDYRLPTGNVEFGIWVRNLEDTVYKTYAFDASQFQKVVIVYVGQPRTVGLELSVSF